MNHLVDQKCEPLKDSVQPLAGPELDTYLNQLSDWQLSADRRVISRQWTVKDFAVALNLVNEIGAIAEAEDHHPDITLHNWNQVTVSFSTHSIGGLSHNDFVVAAKIDRVATKLAD